MSEGDGVGAPPWVQWLRGDISGMENRINSRLDKMVSTDLFVAEQKRVDGRFKDLNDDVIASRAEAAAATAAIAHEREARLRAEADTARVENQQEKIKQEQQSKNRWTVMGLITSVIISPVMGAVVAFVISGGLDPR